MFSDVLIVSVIFGSIVWLIERMVNRRALKKERLKYIESGGDLKDLDLNKSKKKLYPYNSLKYGLIAIAIAIGSLIGSLLEKYNALPNNEIGYISSVALFVGIALIMSHYLAKKEINDK